MRNKTFLALIAVSLLSPISAHAATPTLSELGELTAPENKAGSGVSPIRAAVISSAAMELGSKGGLAARTEELLAWMETRSAQLDRRYRFSPWVRPNGILPPVITEARDAVQSTNDQIRVQDRIYKIVVPARLVRAVAPTWRDYLRVGLSVKVPPAPATSAAYPQTAEERAYWKSELQKGWTYGQKLADEILERNWARLDRDFNGILLYIELLQEGKVAEPSVAVAPSLVTGNKQQLVVGDTLYRITDTGGFITDSKKWQPTVLPEINND